MKNRGFKIFTFVLFLIAIGLLTILVVPLIRNYDNPSEFKEYIDNCGTWGLPVMLFIQLTQIVVALIPGEIIEFVAGTLYGWFWGAIFCLVGVAIGQTIIFKLVRYLGRSFVEKFAGSDSLTKFKFLNDEKKLKTIIFILFFIPGTPKDALTYIVPLTKIKLKDFLLLTLVARIPSIVSSTFAGAAFKEQDYFVLILAYCIIIVFSVLGLLFYHIWSKKFKKTAPSTNEPDNDPNL